MFFFNLSIIIILSNSCLRNEVSNESPSGAFLPTERSCDSKMEGLRPDKFRFTDAGVFQTLPAGCGP